MFFKGACCPFFPPLYLLFFYFLSGNGWKAYREPILPVYELLYCLNFWLGCWYFWVGSGGKGQCCVLLLPSSQDSTFIYNWYIFLLALTCHPEDGGSSFFQHVHTYIHTYIRTYVHTFHFVGPQIGTNTLYYTV